jgi:F420-0:gamma-glutamyl ligase-like protein
MPSYRALAVVTSYWKPEEDYLAAIVKAIATRVDDGDFVVVSEKALSTAVGNIVDESKLLPSLNARCLARWWMRVLWGHVFSRLLGFGPRLTRNLQEYPLKSGSRHKQLALERAGTLQALMFGSEGGIDGSNLPYAFVSLPLKNAPEIAEEICREIGAKLERKVAVMVVDTDKTFTVRNFHFTPRPVPMRGIHGNGGVVTYVIGRMFRFRKRSTPLAVAGSDIEAGNALRIANIADKARGVGSGTTVWKMAKRFQVDLTGVTWEMLSGIKHKPVVIVRKAKPAEKR